MSKLHTLLFVMTVTFSACSNETTTSTETTTDTTTTLKEGAENTMENVKDAMNGNQDSDFVVSAIRFNITELRILQAGLDNGTSNEVKSHAKMMIADHKKLGSAIERYSSSKNYSLPPTDEGKGDEEIADLNKKNRGADWDKAWVLEIIDAHDDAIEKFEKGRDNVKDSALKLIIIDALPKLRAHKNMMETTKDKM